MLLERPPVPAMEAGRTKKRTKAGVLVSSITYADLESCFHMPTERACVKLGVGLTILKRLCRKFGIPRWPYRSLLKAGKAQRQAASVSPSASPRRSRSAGASLPCSTPPTGASRGATFAAQVSSETSHHTGPSNSGCSGQLAGATNAASQLAAAWAPFATATAAAAAAAPTALPSPQGGAAARMEQLLLQLPAAAAAAATVPKSDSQLSLLLSAIDACERGLPVAPQPSTPAERDAGWLPARVPQQPATAFPPAPFHHSGAASAFHPTAAALAANHQLPAPAAPPKPAASAALAAAEQQLESLKLQLLQHKLMLLQVAAGAGTSAAGVAAAPQEAAGAGSASALLRTLIADSQPLDALDDRRRLALAQKLLLVRASLQARIARKRAQLAAAMAGRYEPYGVAPAPAPAPTQPRLLPALEAPSTGPLPLSALTPTGTDLLEGLSATDVSALASARTLLARYHL